MKAIVTVIGRDQVGIIADVCAVLASNSVNILDISQTIMQEYFTMIMLVDTDRCPIAFEALASVLRACGEKRSLTIQIQAETIFNSMHRV